MMRLAFLLSLISSSLAYVKLDANKIWGSWPESSDKDNEPLFSVGNDSDQDQLSSSGVNGTVEWVNDKVFYTIDLLLGENSQNITVLIDTRSSDLWVNAGKDSICAQMDQQGGSTNFITFENVYPKLETSSKSLLTLSTSESRHSSKVTSSETGWNIYYTDITVYENITQILTSEVTSTHKITHYTGFYPSISTSTNWFDAYPTPSFSVGDVVAFDYFDFNCSQWGVFEKENSKSYISNGTFFHSFSIENDSVSGEWGMDYVDIGGALLSNLSFGVVQDSSGFGILGLGLPNSQSTWLQNGTTYENLPMKLKSEGWIDKMVYSFGVSSFNQSLKSSLLFGGIDLEQFEGNLTTVPMIKYPFEFSNGRNSSAMAITIRSIYLENEYQFSNKTELVASGLAAGIIDTGSVIGSMPYYIYDQLVLSAGFEFNDFSENFIANYTKLENKSVIFEFQSVNISMPLLNLTVPLVNVSDASNEISDLVVLAVEASSYDYFELGDAILSHIYYAVDLEDDVVALAPRNFAEHGEHIVEVSQAFPNATRAADWGYTVGYKNVTQVKLATVLNVNNVSKTSLSMLPSATAFTGELYSEHFAVKTSKIA